MRNFVVPILCLLSITAGAQLSVPAEGRSNQVSMRTIEVWGTAETLTPPTSVNFRVKLLTRHSNKSKGLAENDTRLKALKSLAADFDIEEGDLIVDNVRSFEDHRNHVREPYVVERTVSLTLKRADAMDALVRAIVAGGVGDVSSTQLVLADPIKVRNQARSQALIAARDKAESMAATLGEQAGRAYRISEVQANSWNSISANTVTTAAPSQSSERNGMVSTKASVKVTFLLKD